MKKKSNGFTLIELMITVAIVGILASIAYPNYIEQIRKGKRSDAKAALTSFANAMEIYKMQNANSYAGAGNPSDTNKPPKSTVFTATVPVSGGTTTYNLTLTITAATSSTPQGFTLYAAPVDSSDPCGTFSLTNNGVRGVSTTATDCW